MQRIRVTQDDIDYGIRGDCGKCPIARALLRQCPEFATVNVKLGYAFFWHVKYNYNTMGHKPVGDCVAELPKEADLFIFDFDADDGEREVKPFEFDIEIKEVENPVHRV